MVALAPTYSVSKLFFDRAEVMRRVDQARVRVLSRQGAFIRTRARRRILRPRKGVARPDQAPSTHTDSGASLRTILFFYDKQSQSVVVGPVRLNRVRRSGGRLTIPQLHEFGGAVPITEVRYRRRGQWYQTNRFHRPGKALQQRKRVAIYPARPFMSKALDQEIAAGTIATSWRNAVRGS